MTPKRYRDRVTAEITLFHLMQMASERDRSVSREQAIWRSLIRSVRLITSPDECRIYLSCI
jgi:hypothetical protein